MSEKITIEQGDTFTVEFVYKEDNVQTAFPEGYDIAAGFYDTAGNELYVARLMEGGIAQTSESTFAMNVPHYASATMKGRVTMELAILDENKSFVDFASENITFSFQQRKMNNKL